MNGSERCCNDCCLCCTKIYTTNWTFVSENQRNEHHYSGLSNWMESVWQVQTKEQKNEVWNPFQHVLNNVKRSFSGEFRAALLWLLLFCSKKKRLSPYYLDLTCSLCPVCTWQMNDISKWLVFSSVLFTKSHYCIASTQINVRHHNFHSDCFACFSCSVFVSI